jgi:HSP20 family protein
MSIGTLVHRHPMRVAASAMLDAERALDEIQRQFTAYPVVRFGTQRPYAPRISAVENEKEYVVTAELPGVEAEHLDVAIEEGVLSIKVEQKSEGGEASEPDENSAEKQDQSRSVFARKIRFNGEIDEAAVSASYKNGLLTVTLPKPEPLVPEVRSIPVQAD